ncbi:HPr family phosphocarrier protein [Pseudonocardia sp. T1-2H]|uniref:HPr family phosphocarrier protein n=1 Tax=Pseudonocardia sp. T1-2H TaxID=3128899 RepID=UPI0031013730
MPSRTVTVASRVGLHARPAAVFTRAAAAASVQVTLAVAGKDPVNAASVLGVMTLGVECGQEVTLAAEGEGADGALDSLAALLATDLDA